MATFLTYPDGAAQARGLADLVVGELAGTLLAKGRATLAVPGGLTPGGFLRALSGAEIDWARVFVMLTDERFVPESSPRSNTRLLRETLLQGRAAVAHLVPLYMPAARPEDVLGPIEAAIRAALPLDVCVLGMGADMHTASLFPGADNLALALAPDCARAVLPMRADAAPEPRLTLTAPVLRAAGQLHLLIRGADKLAALKRAEIDGPIDDAPVRAILSAPGGVTVHYTSETGI